MALKVSAGGTVWSGANRREGCVGNCTGVLGRGRIIIYSFSRMSLVPCLTLVYKTPHVLYRVPKLLPGRQETAFPAQIEKRLSMRSQEPLPMRPCRPCLRLGQAVGRLRSRQLQAQPHFGGEALMHLVSGDFWRQPCSASTCSPRTFRFHFHPLPETTAPCMRQVNALGR